MKRILCFITFCVIILQSLCVSFAVSATDQVPVSKFIAISASSGTSVALKDDGTVWAWGDNIYMNKVSSIPAKVNGLSNIVAISAGDFHVLALKDDGTVWAWGQNFSGQLGDGTNTSREIPVQIKSLSDIVAISAGADHSVALKKDGALYCWGENYDGQLGDFSAQVSLLPMKCKGLSNIKAIAAKGNQTYAVKKDGSLWGFGNVYFLGINPDIQTGNKPVRIPNLNKVTDIFIGDTNGFAKTEDGSTYAWGSNFYGELGNGNTDHQNTPIKIHWDSDISSISSGTGFTVFLKNDGTLWGRGKNQFGTLGNGTTEDSLSPVRINIDSVVSVASSTNHTLALKSDGSVWAWGQNGGGQLGDGLQYKNPFPQKLLQVNDVKSITAGIFYNSFIKNDGSLWLSGFNYFINTIPMNLATYTKANGISSLKYLSKGFLDTIALKKDGSVLELSHEKQENATKLINVVDISNVNPLYYALKRDGTVWFWGAIKYADKNGLSHDTDISIPIQLKSLQGVIKICNGENTMLALKNDGSVYAWGDNFTSFHGGNPVNCLTTPVKVNGLSNIVAISADPKMNTFVALKKDGTVFTWENNEVNGSSNNKMTQPKAVAGFKNIVKIESGSNCIYAIRKDGTLWVEGENDCGQIGDGTFEPRKNPVMIKGLNNIISVSSCSGNTIALEKNGTVWVWGDNRYGQLGNNRPFYVAAPVKVIIE